MRVEVLHNPDYREWLGVKRRALVTVGKLPNPDKEISIEWQVKMLRCRHSPIRWLRFSFLLIDIPYWLSTELCRHFIGCEKYVKSQRDDRCNNEIPRSDKPQGSLVDMIFDVNAEALLNIMNRRLCGCATIEMQRLMLMIRKEVIWCNPEFSDFLVPQCLRLKDCPEYKSCNGDCLYFKEVKYEKRNM